LLLCTQTLARMSDPKRFRFQGEGFHLPSEKEMYQRVNIKEAITNTAYIAAGVDDIIFDTAAKIPRIANASHLLRAAIEQALQDRGWATDYVLRAGKELEVIERHGFASYFLVVADIVQWARDNRIAVGPGRGSAGGSLVAYLLGITQIDPLLHHTLFERFLVAERRKLPDIDIDFAQREPVIRYIEGKYGRECVAQVATFSTFGERAAVRDVARALERDEEDSDVHDAADKLRGRIRGVSRHAAGVIIAPQAIDVPLMRPVGAVKGANMQTQWEYDDLESLGYLKVDILGVQRLQTLAEVLQNVSVSIPNAVDDHRVYRMLASGDVHGVFQLDSYGGKKVIRELRPQCFEDLVLAIALDRPGPLESGAYDEYIARRHGQQWEMNPVMGGILRDTLGVIIFQEQVMAIAQQVAGYTPGEADDFRAAMGKKKPDVMAAQKEKFIQGCSIDKDSAETLFTTIEHYAGYAFNRSHAVAYAMIAYQCAWLKYYFPVQWYCAMLNERRDDQKKLRETISEVRSKQIPFYPADIDKSRDLYTVENNGIRVGLTGIQDFGQVAYNELRRVLDIHHDIQTLLDLVRVAHMAKLNSKAVTALINAGAMERFGDPGLLLKLLPQCLDQKRRETHERFKLSQRAKGLTLAGTPLKRPAKATGSL
jgi:DNA polymerase-3 subunit alpha